MFDFRCTLSYFILDQASQEPDLQALVVSQETVGGVQPINDERAAKGFDPLIAVVVPLIDGGSGGGDVASKMSSTAIRQALAASDKKKQ